MFTSDPRSYCPISKSSKASKLLKRLVSRQLPKRLQSSDLLSAYQLAYRPILRILSDVPLAVDNGQVAALPLLDLSATCHPAAALRPHPDAKLIDNPTLLPRISRLGARRRPVSNMHSRPDEPDRASRFAFAIARRRCANLLMLLTGHTTWAGFDSVSQHALTMLRAGYDPTGFSSTPAKPKCFGALHVGSNVSYQPLRRGLAATSSQPLQRSVISASIPASRWPLIAV